MAIPMNIMKPTYTFSKAKQYESIKNSSKSCFVYFYHMLMHQITDLQAKTREKKFATIARTN